MPITKKQRRASYTAIIILIVLEVTEMIWEIPEDLEMTFRWFRLIILLIALFIAKPWKPYFDS